jgi:peptidase E
LLTTTTAARPVLNQAKRNAVPGQIIAMGGGGFSMEPENPLLDDFILSLASRHPPRICFIPTASAESATYIVRFYRAFSGRSVPTDLTIFDHQGLPRQPAGTSDLGAFLAEQDIIYVGGGNTANLLAIWRTHGLDKLLRDVCDSGTILCGISAGMICWFNGGVTDSFGGVDAIDDGLGLIDATACPHYDGERERRPAYHRLVGRGFQGGYAADDGAALHFRGGEIVQVVSSRPNAAGYKVEMVQGSVVETRLETRFLGGTGGHSGA